MNLLFKKWINYFSEKNSILEFLFFIFLLAIWGLYFIPIYKSGFIYWNDFDLLSKFCEQKAFTTIINQKIEPIFYILGILFCKFNITQPTLYHYINTTLHISSSILIFYFLRILFSRFIDGRLVKIISVVCALIFCFHPINIDVVFWIYSVKELFLTFFCLLSLVCYLNFLKHPHSKISYLLSLLFLIFSCISSRYCYQIFIFYLGLGIFFSAKKSFRTTMLTILPFLMIIAFTFYVYFINDFYQYTFFKYSGKGLLTYLVTFFAATINDLIFPVNRPFYIPLTEYIDQLQLSNIIFSVSGLLILVSFLLFGYIKKIKLLQLSSTLIIILLIINHSFIELKDFVSLNHLNYFTSFGFALFIGTIFGFTNLKKKITITNISIGLVSILILTLSISSFHKMRSWENEIAFWNSVLKFYPQSLFVREQKAQSVEYHKNLILSNYGRERPNIQFDNKLIDLGNIANNINPNIEFRFQNLGNNPVVINKVFTSCGCTSARWTKSPVLPNNHGNITVGIDTGDFNGFFSKSVVVKFNKCDEPFRLTIKGNVKVQI